MPDVEVDFPRGGELAPVVSTRKPIAKRKKEKTTEKDQKSKKSRTVDPEYEHVFTKYVTKELLTEDVRALGIVKKINETDVILETTNGLKVKLDPRSISSEFTKNLGKTSLDEIFEVGQALAFKVVKAAKQKKEEPIVTIDPAALNCHLVPAAFKNALVINGAVSSIEDKGAVINIGLSKVNGFVKDEDLPPNWKLDKLHVGQVLMFRVRKVSDSKVQRVIDLSAFVEMDVYSDGEMSLSDLMPGTIVSVEPDKLVQSGVFGGLNNDNKIFINKAYLPPRIRLDPSRFVKAIRAVVICTLPNSPIFVVSAHPDIVAISKAERRQLPEELKPGKTVKCTVYDVDKFGNVYYFLGDDKEKPMLTTALSTKIHIDDFETNISKFKIGSTHECKIVSYRSLDRTLIVSKRKDVMKQKVIELTDVVPGERMNVVVYQIKDNGLLVKLGTKGEDGTDLLGFIPIQHVSDRTRSNWKKQFEVGLRLPCRVLSYNEEKNRLYLTAKSTLVNSTLTIVKDLERALLGEIVVGTAINPFESGAFLIQFYNNVAGFLPANEAKTLPDLKEGDTVKARVAHIDLEKRRILLTLREANEQKVLTKKPKEELAEATKTVQVKRPAKPFQVCQARVLGPWKHGRTSPYTTAELRLQGGTIGRLHVSELDLSNCADSESPMKKFLENNIGKFVEIKVICVGNKKTVSEAGKNAIVKKSGTTRFVDCTMIKSKIAEPFRKLRLINFQLSFERGDKINIFIGDATKAQKEGNDYVNAEISPLFFAKIPSLYFNLAKDEDQNDHLAEDSAFKFSNGEFRRGLVISQEQTKRNKVINVALGDCIIKEELEYDKASQISRGSKRKRRDSQRSNASDDGAEIKVFEGGIQDPGFDFSLGMFSMSSMANVGKKAQKSKKTNEDEESEDELEIKDEPEDDDEQSLLRRERRIQERASKLREAIPEHIADFDRLLTGSPNSSDLWIKYITYFLRDEKVKEAREIAERALTSVNFRESTELFNIWTAYLNLEVMFGDEETLKAVFDRATAANDSLKMHKQMAKILAHHKRREQLDELFETMIKKFRHEDLEVWFAYAAYLFESERLDDARALLQKALDSLSRKHHLSVLSRFAQMEYRLGDEERAKTMFEKILQTYPKKTDVWNVYMDMSLKHEGIAEARKLFQRAVSADLGAYRTRIFYEKWIKAEEQYGGDEENLEMVKEHASEFLEKRRQEDKEDEEMELDE